MAVEFVSSLLDELYTAEALLLVTQAVLLWRILRDLGAIDIEKLLAAIKAPRAAPRAAQGERVRDAKLSKEQRTTLIALNSSDDHDNYGFDSDDVLRALVYCDFDSALVEQKLASNRAWHTKYKPRQVTPAQLSNSLPSGVLRLGGFSRCGWPVVECLSLIHI